MSVYMEPGDSEVIALGLIECRNNGIVRSEARRYAIATVATGDEGIHDDVVAFIDGMISAVYDPSGCALCGAHDVYVGIPHVCPERLDVAAVTGPAGAFS